MKKLLPLTLAAILFCFANNALAFNKLFGDLSINGNDYTIADYSNAGDSYVGDPYFGYTGSDWSGYYIGTAIDVNTSPTAMSELINYYLGYDYEYNEIKYETTKEDENANTPGSGTVGPLTVTWDADLKQGTWSFTPESEIELGFYAVKGGNDFALYFIHPDFLSDGLWTTAHLAEGIKDPSLSHFSAAAQVPEPSTMLLLGAGLIGLAGLGRKKFMK